MRPCSALLFALALAFTPWPAVAQSQPALEVQPAAIAVSPWYQDVSARVVLRNPGTKPLLDAAISYFTNDGFQVELQQPSAPRIQPSGTLTVPVRIKQLTGARIPGSIQFEARYKGEDGAVQRSFASLSLTAQADAQKPVEVSLTGSFDAIAGNEPGEGYLLVADNLDVPVSVSGVDVLVPRSLKAVEKIERFDVAPHSSAYKTFYLEAADRVRPGKYSIVIAVNAEWDSGGHHTKQNFVVNRDVTVGVFFESELLKALGVPSFLLLPGCLFIFTMQLMLTLGVLGVKNDSGVPQLTVASPGFWILSVTFSAIFALVYRAITGTDYLSYYGVRDLTNVWLASIGLGFIAYLLIAGIWAHRRKARTPTAQDEPVTALRRMQQNGVPIVTAVVTYKLNGLDLQSFVIEQIRDDQTLVWVAPKIITEWTGDPQMQSNFETAINERKSASQIADILTEARNKGAVSVRWSGTGTVPNPYHLKVDAITGYQPPDVIVAVS